MFKRQIEELQEMVNTREDYIMNMEIEIKTQKELLRDAKQALSSLERLQTKYEPKTNEDPSVSI